MQLYLDRRTDVGTTILGSRGGVLLTAPEGLDHDYVFETEAEIVVDPQQGRDSDPWWIIARTCNDLAAYYRTTIAKRFGIRLLKPSFDAHITVLAGEPPRRNAEAWRQPHGRRVRFAYTHEVFGNGVFWWLRVRCPELDAIRARFGHAPAGRRDADGVILSKVPLHLTVGKTHPSDIRLVF